MFFNKGELKTNLKSYHVSSRRAASCRNRRDLLEPKHVVIKSLCIRLESSAPKSCSRLLALQAVPISDDLYNSDFTPAFEMANGFLSEYSTQCLLRWRNTLACATLRDHGIYGGLGRQCCPMPRVLSVGTNTPVMGSNQGL